MRTPDLETLEGKQRSYHAKGGLPRRSWLNGRILAERKLDSVEEVVNGDGGRM